MAPENDSIIPSGQSKTFYYVGNMIPNQVLIQNLSQGTPSQLHSQERASSLDILWLRPSRPNTIHLCSVAHKRSGVYQCEWQRNKHPGVWQRNPSGHSRRGQGGIASPQKLEMR